MIPLDSAPHGGTREIPGVPPRKGEGLKKGPSGFVTARDGGVEELARGVAEALRERTGKKPYLVVASFHRKYADCNRPPSIAYEHDGAKAVYEEYHGALARYCAAVVRRFGGGLVVDLHGQGSARDRVFRGTRNGRTNALMQERFGREVHVGPRSLMGMLKARGWAVHPEDDDGSVYFLWHSGKIARMKPDMSGLAEPYRWLKTTVPDPDPRRHSGLCARIFGKDSFDHVGFEGMFIFKAEGRYYLSCADCIEGRYSCMIAVRRDFSAPTVNATRPSLTAAITCSSRMIGASGGPPISEATKAPRGGRCQACCRSV